MSSTQVRLTLLFKASADADHFEQYFHAGTGDDTELHDLGWPAPEAWIERWCVREGQVVRAGGVLSPDVVMEELAELLMETTALLVIRAFHDQVGEDQRLFYVDGRAVGERDAEARASVLGIDLAARPDAVADDAPALAPEPRPAPAPEPERRRRSAVAVGQSSPLQPGNTSELGHGAERRRDLRLRVCFRDEQEAERFAGYCKGKAEARGALRELGWPDPSRWYDERTYRSGVGVWLAAKAVPESDIEPLLACSSARAAVLVATVYTKPGLSRGADDGSDDRRYVVEGVSSRLAEAFEAALELSPSLALAVALEHAELAVAERAVARGADALTLVEDRVPALLYERLPPELAVALLSRAVPAALPSLHEALMMHWAEAPEVLTRLLALGAPPHFVAANGETPLLRAITVGAAESVRTLLAAGADPNLGRKAPLLHALKRLDDLVNSGTTTDRMRALARAAFVPVVELLIEHGANVAVSAEDGANVRWLAGGSKQIMELLDRHGVPEVKVAPRERLDDAIENLERALRHGDAVEVTKAAKRLAKRKADALYEVINFACLKVVPDLEEHLRPLAAECFRILLTSHAELKKDHRTWAGFKADMKELAPPGSPIEGLWRVLEALDS